MVCLIAEPEFPMWLLATERFGIQTIIIVFGMAVTWKLVPATSRLLGAWKRQSDKVTEAVESAVPKVLDGMRDLVQHAERIADHMTRGEREHPEQSAGGARIRAVRPDPRRGDSGCSHGTVEES